MGVIAPEKRSSNEAAYVGETVLDGTNPTPITTPFSTVTGVKLTLEGSTAPGLNTSTLTYAVSGGVVSVYAWKPTGAGDPTLEASTGTETFSYQITGY